MQQLVVCLTDAAIARFVLVAVVVCWTSCSIALRLLDLSAEGRGAVRFAWLTAASLSAGGGFWSTHAIAMLAYDPVAGVGYDPAATLASALFAVGSAQLAFSLHLLAPSRAGRALAGLVIGLGLTAMHIVGTEGIRLPGDIVWNPSWLAAGLASSCICSVAALMVVRRSGEGWPRIWGPTWLTIGMVVLHVVALAALDVVGSHPQLAVPADLPRAGLTGGLAVAMLVVLAFGALSMFADRQRTLALVLADRQAALTVKTALLDATLDNMDQGILLVDASGLVRVCNVRALALLDLPGGLMQGQPAYSDVHRHLLAAWSLGSPSGDPQGSASSAGYGPGARRYDLERRDGTTIEVRSVPLPDGGVVLTYTDVTDRRRREAILADDEARLRALADALPQMIWVARASDGVMTYANQRFHSYFGEIGLTRQERIAAHHPDDRNRTATAWAAAHEVREVMEIEARWRRADGRYLWHKLILAPVWKDGVLAEWLGSALDIDDIVEARNALREQTDLLHFAQGAAGAGLFDWDLNTGRARLSPESLRLFGLDEGRTHAIEVGEIVQRIHTDDRAAVAREADRAASTRTDYRVEFRICRTGVPDRWVLGNGQVVSDDAGRPCRIVGLNLDMTDRKRVEETLRISEERLALALASGSDGLWDWDVETGSSWYSDQWHTMLGYEPGELDAHSVTWERLIHPEDRDRAIALTAEHFADRTSSYECEHRLRRKDGDWGWVLSRGKVVRRAADGRPLRIVGTHIDIGARKAAEQRIAYMARHDALTDLPNRVTFRDRLDLRLSELAAEGGTCAVFCLDLDRFKVVNDSLGHLAGDTLLREVALRLRALLDSADVLARLGGDEFAIVVHDAGSVPQLAGLAERLVAATGRAVVIGDESVEVGVSIGIARAPEHGVDAETLFRRADLAMYRAKAEGRHRVCWFEAAMDAEASERRQLQQDLQRALLHDEFTLHYQPQALCGTGDIVGFEALVRWQHPVQGIVPPARFIPLAEESGIIVELGLWALRAACTEAAQWANPLRIAVNVSPRQFQQADLPERVLAILTETGLPPARLELEITESLLINDMARAVSILRRLKGIGVRIAMDDFGTGYSSLATLQAFPFDKLKIDRSFVWQLHQNAQAAVIVRTMVGLGRSLAISVIAEGVETDAQRQFLEDEMCDELQGYLVGRPEPIQHYAEVAHHGLRGGDAERVARRFPDRRRGEPKDAALGRRAAV